MTHYVCPECRAVSHYPGRCQTDDCIYQGLEYKTCNCEDGQHEGVVNKSDANPSDDLVKETTLDLDNTP